MTDQPTLNQYANHDAYTLDIAFVGPPLLPAPAVQAAEAGVEFSVTYANGRYTVAMRPTVTPAQPGLTLVAQVTVKVAHGVGSQRFVVSDVQSLVTDTRWTARSRVDASKEDRTADYISNATFVQSDAKSLKVAIF